MIGCRDRRRVWALCVVFGLAARVARADEPAPAPHSHRLAVSTGFSHWFGPTYGSPKGFTTPMIAVGVRPGVAFLELRVRYAISVPPLPQPSGGTATVGFASLEVLATHGIAAGSNRIDLSVGPFAALVHSGGLTAGMGLVLGASWTFALGDSAAAVGPFFESRAVNYKLPGDTGGLLSSPRVDAQVDLGVVFTVW